MIEIRESVTGDVIMIFDDYFFIAEGATKKEALGKASDYLYEIRKEVQRLWAEEEKK